MVRAMMLAIVLFSIVGAAAGADDTPPCSSQGIAEFFQRIKGEWVGQCKHTTDGQSTDDDYFHADVKETSPGVFEARFDYFRMDEKGALLHIGSSSVTAKISSATCASSRVVGDGEIYVDRKIKRQEHDITEDLTATGAGQISGRGSGSLKVAGMPLGLGKLGRVKDDQSTWSVSNGSLSVHQSMNIVFRALFVSKSFKVEADYTAVRGSDVLKIKTKP